VDPDLDGNALFEAIEQIRQNAETHDEQRTG
jgi:hypothetical protein